MKWRQSKAVSYAKQICILCFNMQEKCGVGIKKTLDLLLHEFREFFGCSLLVACNLWQLLLDCSLLPDGVYIYHLLWSLMFLKVYSKERIMCTLAGVDKKTFRKWIWIFINAIVNLSPDIVSYFIVYFYQNVFLLTKQFVL